MLGKYKIRIVHIWLGRVFWGILLFRIERGLYLTFGSSYSKIRIIFIPIINIIQSYSNLELHYKAEIGPGFLILHPSIGVVVSGQSVIGSNLTLTGGNTIGTRAKCKYGEFVIGNNCSLGANAVVLGPLILGNDITVGASACIVKDCKTDHSILVGIPGKRVERAL